MTVLFVAGDADYSGATLSMLTLIELLKADGVKSMVVLPYAGRIEGLLAEKQIEYFVINSNRWIRPIGEKGSVWTYLKRFKLRLQNISAVKRIRKIIKRKKVDLIHVNTLAPYVGAVAARITKTPYIWHIREFGEEDHGQTIWNKKSGYKLISGAARVITISESLYEKFKRQLPNARVQMIYNGIDVEKYFLRREQLLCKNIVTITISGRISEGKGQLELIQAANELKDHYECFRIQIVGSNGKKAYVDSLKEYIEQNGLDPWVKILGFRKEMRKVWEATDICVVCSRAEAFGRVTVESMLAGCLVIGANTAGTAEIIKDGQTGFLYQQGCPNDLYKTIDYALKNKEKVRAIAVAGQRDVGERFTAKLNEQQIYKLYIEILEKKLDVN